MVKPHIYLVRNIKSKLYFPDPKGRAGRGGSHTEPTEQIENARIFGTLRGAKSFISAWVQGKFVANRGMSHGHPGNDWESEYYEDIEIIPVPDRFKENLEVIPCLIVPIDTNT